MADFDLFLDSILNERFIDDSTNYYQDPYTGEEIDDTESGLAGEFTPDDIRHLNRDFTEHGTPFKCLMKPDRVGTNYVKSDALSCYKILPKGQKPIVWTPEQSIFFLFKHT